MRRAKELAIGGGRIKRNRPKPITLIEFFEHDSETVRGTVKPNTIEAMRHSIAHARNALGDSCKLSGIERAAIAELKCYLLDMVKLSETTMGKTFRILKAMLNRAVAAGFIEENPFVGIRLPKAGSRVKRIYSSDETRAMRRVASSLWWQAFILVAETTGARKGEFLNLHWRDVDFEAKLIRIAAKKADEVTIRGKTYPILPWSATSYEERAIPLPDAALNLLARLHGESDASPYVFISLKRLGKIGEEIAAKGKLGPNYEPVNNLKARFDLIQKKARILLAAERGVAVEQVPWVAGTLHDLRRTYGTRMARVIPMHTLKEFMGHAKITTTQEFYLAAETQDADTARVAMDKLLAPDIVDSGRNKDAIGTITRFREENESDPKSQKSRILRDFQKRGGRESNPQPPNRQSGTLTN